MQQKGGFNEMRKTLKFKKEPKLSDLEGLNINGARFERDNSMVIRGDVVLMNIPNTFRFQTNLEIVDTIDGDWFMIMTQFLTRGPEYWEMERAFERIGFRNPEIEGQMRLLCDELIKKDLAYWEEY